MAFALLGEEEEAYEELQNEVPNLIVEELEKIKAELEKEEYAEELGGYVIPANKVYEILNKHISELKGE